MSEPTVLWERLPVDHPVTFGFGETSPPYSVAAPHRGCDYAVPVGTPVYAPAAGIVHLHVPGDGYGNGSFGNHILIDHGDGWPTLLAHLLSFTGAGAQGATVKAGDLIAYSGNTGTSTGPHLHAQRDCKGGLTVTFSDCRDPLDYLGGLSVEEKELLKKLAGIVAGNGIDVNGQRLTGDAAINYLDADGASLALGQGILQGQMIEVRKKVGLP